MTEGPDAVAARFATDTGPVEIEADIVVGADGNMIEGPSASNDVDRGDY